MLASLERTLLEVATPFLEDLYERTHETVHLGVREGAEVVYVAKVAGHRQVRSPTRIGGRMPLHSTALGKALLAHAGEEVRVAVLRAPARAPHRRARSPHPAGCASSWTRVVESWRRVRVRGVRARGSSASPHRSWTATTGRWRRSAWPAR